MLHSRGLSTVLNLNR